MKYTNHSIDKQSTSLVCTSVKERWLIVSVKIKGYMAGISAITEKIADVLEEMKRSGLYKKEFPAWVNEYEKVSIVTEHDFSGWLQFVYLPNLLQQSGKSSAISQKKNIVPQALEFYGDDIKKGKLLQLLIELDSLV